MHRSILCAAALLVARSAHADVIQVAPSGSDESGDGSSAKPFASLARGVKAAGDKGGAQTVALAAGSYVVASRVNVPPGVSIQGAGRDATTLDCSGLGVPSNENDSTIGDNSQVALALVSSGASVDGSQSVSGVRLKASRDTSVLVLVQNRNKVTLSDVAIEGSLSTGLWVRSVGCGNTVSDFELSDFVIKDASRSKPASYGNAMLEGNLTHVRIHDGQVLHPLSMSGYGIKFRPSYTCTEGDDPLDEYKNEATKYQFELMRDVEVRDVEIAGNKDTHNYSTNISLEIYGLAYDGVHIASSRFDNIVSLPANYPVPRGGSRQFDRPVHIEHNAFANQRNLTLELGQSGAEVDHNVFDLRQTAECWNVIGEYNSVEPPTAGQRIHHNLFLGAGGSLLAYFCSADDIEFANNTVDGFGTGVEYRGASTKPGSLRLVNNVMVGGGSSSPLITTEGASAPSLACEANLWPAGTSFGGCEGGGNQPGQSPQWAGGEGAGAYVPSSATSNLVDQGKDVGYDFAGSSPDLGAFEFGEPPWQAGLGAPSGGPGGNGAGGQGPGAGGAGGAGGQGPGAGGEGPGAGGQGPAGSAGQGPAGQAGSAGQAGGAPGPGAGGQGQGAGAGGAAGQGGAASGGPGASGQGGTAGGAGLDEPGASTEDSGCTTSGRPAERGGWWALVLGLVSAGRRRGRSGRARR